MALPSPASSPRPDFQDRRAAMQSVRTLVVKVGTNVLTRESGEMSLGRIHCLVEDLADLHRGGRKVILVSSGAVSMGAHRMGLEEMPTYLRDKQACAAVGQIRLMSVYQQAFHQFGVPAGQILLTEDDFRNRRRYLNLRNTLHRLLEYGVLPIINENDSVATREIEEAGPSLPGRKAVFGDNDVLSALLTSKLGADLLVILTDVDGFYADGPPERGEVDRDDAIRPLSLVEEITPELEAGAGAGGMRGRGGMATKLEAVQIAVQSGSMAAIVNGVRAGALREFIAGEETGTLFLPRRRLASRKRWIAFASAVAGRIVVNAGARAALCERRSSLLFAGVTRLAGAFRKGDVVGIVDEQGEEFARGIPNYDAAEARPLVGLRSEEIVGRVGRNYEELVNRDNLAIQRE